MLGSKLIMKILITGITGFVGSHIAKRLVNENQVYGLIRKESDIYRIKRFVDKKYLFDTSVLSIEEIVQKIKPNCIIHTATNYGKDGNLANVISTNIKLPIEILHYGVQNGLELFLNTDSFFTKKTDYDYLNAYTTSKRHCKEWLEQFKDKVKIINLRLEHVYGSDDSENKFVTHILHRILKNEKEIALTNGLQRRDFVYIDDVVEAFVTILKNNGSFSNSVYDFEVGTGESVSIRKFVELLHENSGSISKLNFGALPMRKREFTESKADISDLEQLGWKPKIDVNKGIKNLIIFEKNKLQGKSRV